MADSLTPNLKLRVSDDLTADAKYNLNRIDSLASATKVENNGNLRVRSIRDIIITPESQDLGGNGTGGTVSVGESGVEISVFEIFAELADFNDTPALLKELRFPELTGGNYVGFAPPDVIDANQLWKLPNADGTVNQVLVTDGDGNLGWATVLTDSLAENNVNVGNASDVSAAVDTSAVGDILASSTGGFTIKAGTIVNADINAAANIDLDKLESVTMNMALVSDASGKVTASAVTATEQGYLSGVTSALQTQLNAKEPTITVLSVAKGGTNSGTTLNNNRIMKSAGDAVVEASAITPSRALISDANGIPTHSAATAAELAFLSGLSSSAQTQLDNKQPLDSTLTALAAYNTSGFITQTAPDTFVGRTLEAGTGISIDDGDGVAGNPVINSTITQYTDEMAEDAVGGILLDSNSIDLSYDDTNITADLKLSIASADAGNFNAVTSIESDGLQVQVQQSDITTVITGRQFAANWITADGTTKSITHNLNSRDIMIQVYDASTYETIYMDSAIRTSTNAIDLTANQAPASTWRVLISKVG